MKYIICYFAAFILFIPPIIMGCITWIWKPNRAGFLKGSQYLDNKYNYGKLIDNLLEN